MEGYKLIIAYTVVFYYEVQGHSFHTRSRSIHKPLFKDSCSYTSDDLASLLALSRKLDEKEEPKKELVTTPALFNADELIMKLVNALVYATTQNVQNHCHCHCTHTFKPSASDDTHNNGGVIRPNNSENGHSNDGLLNLDLLNSKKRNNVLDLDLSNQHLVGVGLGGRNRDENSYTSSSAYSRAYSNNDPDISSSRSSSSKNSNSLIDVTLLDSRNRNNVAAVNLEKQNVIGVGLLGGGKGNEKQDNSNEGLVNLRVLNANKDNNVAELAVAGENIVGVGIGG